MTYHNTPLSWSKSIIHISKIEMDTDNSVNQTISLSCAYIRIKIQLNTNKKDDGCITDLLRVGI